MNNQKTVENLMGAFDDVTQIGMMASNTNYQGKGGQSQQQPNFFNAMQQYGQPNNGYNGMQS